MCVSVCAYTCHLKHANQTNGQLQTGWLRLFGAVCFLLLDVRIPAMPTFQNFVHNLRTGLLTVRHVSLAHIAVCYSHAGPRIHLRATNRLVHDVCVCADIQACQQIDRYVNIHIHIHVHVHVHVHVHTHIHTFVHIQMHTSMHAHLHTYIHAHACKFSFSWF